QKQGLANVITPPDDYRRHIENFVAINELRNADALVIADPMHGTGGRWIETMLAGGKIRVETIRAERDPLFGGVLPDPKSGSRSARMVSTLILPPASIVSIQRPPVPCIGSAITSASALRNSLMATKFSMCRR